MARNRIDARTHPVPLFDISRRDLIVGGGAMVAAFGLPMPLLADQPSPASTPAPHGDSQGENLMNVITAREGTKSISRSGVLDNRLSSHTVGRSLRMHGTHRCC